jgi:hypothetical protein
LWFLLWSMRSRGVPMKPEPPMTRIFMDFSVVEVAN